MIVEQKKIMMIKQKHNDVKNTGVISSSIPTFPALVVNHVLRCGAELVQALDDLIHRF
jgi:hypothetical protein